MGKLLESRPFRALERRHGAALVTDLLRAELAELRERLTDGRLQAEELGPAAAPDALAGRVEARIEALLAPRPRTVINATGVVVHTNLGRSVLDPEVARRVAELATTYQDLEFDLATGKRGSRMDHLTPPMARLFPDHDFLVVNNNAAAIMLALRALARGKQVVVSRGELVEIGGSFRVPDILATSGARLAEVGTTNRTRATDYEQAIGPRTGALLKVHTSNFKVVGFAEETGVAALARIADAAGIPLVVDWGSGDLIDLAPLGITDEVPVRELLRQGAGVVTFSGDKLFGGPQAGFLVGRPELMRRIRRDPLARVCRLDRLLVGAVHATLTSYVAGREMERIPTLRMLALSAEEIGRRARRVVKQVRDAGCPRGRFAVVEGVSKTGGGSSPTGERPTRLIAVSGAAGDAARLERLLRRGDPPVVGRVGEGKLLLDLRTVLPEQDEALAGCLARAIAAEAAG